MKKFDLDRIMAFLQKWRVRLGHVFTVVLLLTAGTPGRLELIVGTLVALAGEAIRIASAGMIDKDAALSRRGPYAYVRNPLYLGSFLMYFGFCIACSNPWVTLAFMPFFYAVYMATILREEQFLSKKFGEDFTLFTDEVPRFFPRLTPAPGKTPGEFSWKRVKLNKEYEGAFATVAVLAILWIFGLMYFSPMDAILRR